MLRLCGMHLKCVATLIKISLTCTLVNPLGDAVVRVGNAGSFIMSEHKSRQTLRPTVKFQGGEEICILRERARGSRD